MNKFNFTSVDRVLSKLHREVSQVEELDAIEWIGEALEFLQVKESADEALCFMKVKNYETEMPEYLLNIIQIARYNNYEEKQDYNEETQEEEEIVSDTQEENCLDTNNPLDCETGSPLFGGHNPLNDYYPNYNINYQTWITSDFCVNNFSVVRLANHSFFNSVVCPEKDLYEPQLHHDETFYQYPETIDEYTIIGTVDRKLRFSFKEGYIAIAYMRTAVDEETGYPLIPDEISYITAITYYLKWKLAEVEFDSQREGSLQRSQVYEQKWLKYARQAKNNAKMPKTVDDYQNLLEASHYLIPRHDRYYNYFGKLGRREERPFNNPDQNKRLNSHNENRGFY